jgi:transposase
MANRPRKRTPPDSGVSTLAAGEELPERWSIQRKTELVLRLLRGEGLDAVSRESQVPGHELEAWKRAFLEADGRGLRTRAEPEERELTLARAKIGELMMRLELAEHLIEKRGFADEWRKHRR